MFTQIYNRAKNLWRQKSADRQATNEGYLPYFDEHDNFPLKWAKAIQESPSATSCLSTLSDFIEGEGFSEGEGLENLIVNSKGETFFQIHHKTCEEFSQNEGFYWLIKYNGLAGVAEWEVLPFENCRLGKPDDNGYVSKIFYNAYFGTSFYKKADTVIYDVYNPKAVKEQYAAQGANYKGQVYFFGTTNPLSRFYPIPKPYAAVKWFSSEAGIADHYEDKIDNGFMNDFMLLLKGDPNAPSTNPDYASAEKPITVAEEMDAVMRENFMGRGKQNNVMIQWLNNNEEKPEILPFPTSGNTELFLAIDNQATKKITVAWNVPAILANISEGVSLGGDGNQIRVAVKLMQQRVVKRQRMLTDAYSVILKKLPKPYLEPVSITPYNPYPELEVLDDKIWNEMSTEERREWIQDKTEIDFNKNEVVNDPSQPLPSSKALNAIPVGFPEGIRNNIKKTLKYIDTMEAKCGGKAGRALAEQIAANSSLPLKQIKRIHSYLKKNIKYAGSAYNEGCGALEYHAWGGKDMFDFLDTKLKEVDTWLN